MFYGSSSERVVAVKVRQYVVVYTKKKALIELILGIGITSSTKAIIVKAFEMNSLRFYDSLLLFYRFYTYLSMITESLSS